MDSLGYAEWVTSLLWLAIAAGVAFAIGLWLRYRRAKIQERYQNRFDDESKQESEPK